jgi:hypothetical protein
MHASLLYSVTLGASLTLAAPAAKREEFSPDNVYFPLKNGFPNVEQAAIIEIQDGAHGTLPNGPPPPALSPEGVTNLKLIALNELFEVAFFGYDLGYGHDYVLDSLNAIVNQEQLHLLNANGALEHFKADKIQPCKYSCKYIMCLSIDHSY